MKKRPLYAAAGVIVLLFAGVLYAWSVLSLPIGQEFAGWTKLDLSITFTIAMVTFCLAGLVGGIMLGRGVNVRVNIGIAAAAMLAGFWLASFAQSPLQLYLGFGVLVGLGSGLAYNAVISNTSKWFPDKQGFISGVLLMGFGIGSFLIGKVYQAVLPGLDDGWRTAFRFMGILVCVIFVAALPFFVKPEPGEVPAAAKKKSAVEYSTLRMLKTPSFYAYYLWAILLSACGLVLVGQASGIVLEVSPAAAAGFTSTVVGLISIMNGIGRVIFGRLYDKKGHKATMYLVIFSFLVTTGVLALAISLGALPLVVIGFIIGGFSYGGVTPTNAALTADFYGNKYYSINFAIAGSNLIFASFSSSIAGALYDRTQSFFSAIIMMAICAIAGFFCMFAVKKPTQ